MTIVRSNLSDDAKIVAGTVFGMMTTQAGRLRFVANESRPTPRMQAALDELVGASVIRREEQANGNVDYRPVAPLQDYVQWTHEHPEAGRGFTIAEPTGQTAVILIINEKSTRG